MTIGKKIRTYREFRGMNQIELAKLSGINVGTIRKYEIGNRNPKPEQLEKIASALGLNVSVFFDFNLETTGDIMALLFAIEDAVDISFSNNTDKTKNKVTLSFDKPALNSFMKDWAVFKQALDKANKEALTETEESIKEEKLAKNTAMYDEWKLRMMVTNPKSNMIVSKKTDGIQIKDALLDTSNSP